MKTEYLGITIDRTRDKTMPEQARELVKGYYLRGKEKSPQEAYARASVAYCDGDLSLAQRLYDAVSNGWFMFSSPVLSNAPAEGEQAKGLPISCFLLMVLLNTNQSWLGSVLKAVGSGAIGQMYVQ